MRLATKLVSAFMVVALIVIGLDTAVAVRAELAGFEDQTRQDMKQVGLSLRGLLADASRAGRHAQAMEEIASRMPDGYHMHLRWVWIEGGPGEPRESGVTSAELQRAAEGIVYRDGTGSEWSMLAYVQVPTGDERVGAIEIEERPVRREQILAVLTTRAWRVSALLLLLAGVASVIVGSRMVARPRTADGRYIELQGTAEETPFSRDELDRLLALADTGIDRLLSIQRESLGASLDSVSS